MTILTATQLKKSFGTDVIFDQATFMINEGDKIGVLGMNGTGKTTLFRILTGEYDYDEGTLVKEKGLTMAYMEQTTEYTSEKTAYEEVLTVFEPLMEQERLMEETDRRLEQEQTEELIRKQASLRESFQQNGGLTYRSRARAALLGLGLSEQEINQPMHLLSGGQRTRVSLARLLLADAKLLLLDEPTNHLDLAAIQWLETFLSEYKGSLMLISHDRFFLDRITNKTFEIENRKLTVYGGNYSYYKEKKAFDRMTLERDYEQKSKEIARIEGIIAQQKHFGQERNYITIKSKQKQIDRIKETLEKPEQDPETIGFSFKACNETGEEVLIGKDLSKAFGQKKLFHHIDVDIRRGERIFLTGPNGCGKTTLLRIFMHQVSPDTGTTKYGARVRIGYYDQTVSDMQSSKTIFEELSDAFPMMGNTQIRKAAAVFLFKDDDVFKRMDMLSGGEKARVALVKLMLSPHNVLILDEPTNHLDIASKEALEDALMDYDGTILAVSHDRYFMNRLATGIYDMQADDMHKYKGNYDSFLEQKAWRKPTETVTEVKIEKPNAYKQRKEEEAERRKRKNRIAKIEEETEKLEQEIAKDTAYLSDPVCANDYAKLMECTAIIQEKQKNLDALYEEWETLMEQE